MATKTISIDLEAYERLCRARTAPGESFSQVIKRAQWPHKPHTAAGFLEAIASTPVPAPSVIERLDEAQAADEPPEDPWRAD